MSFEWPPRFARIPDEDWTRAPVEGLARNYDTVESHGWYANLDPTVSELTDFVRDGSILVDYSGGTGILIERLLRAMPEREFGVVNVDSSPKFLRLALEKFADEDRVAFRRIRFLREQGRLEFVHEVLGIPLADGGVDGVVSTNAIHLYYDLGDTLASWARILRPGGTAFVQSGNIGREKGESGGWIIDDTVHEVAQAAKGIAVEDARFAAYREALDDPARMKAHDALRHKYFLPVRALSHYTGALEGAGFRVTNVARRPIRAETREWLQFLNVYNEGIVGWVGGTEKIEGRAPDEAALKDRAALLEAAIARVFHGESTFDAEWTYITAETSRR